MPGEISVFHTIADIRPQSGGTSRVVVDLADALGKQASIKPALVTQSLVGDPALPSLNPSVQRVIADAFSTNALRFGLPFRGALEKAIKDLGSSLIHSHGLWMPVNHWAARLARKHGIALIIQPHGMLEPWALNHKAWKKRIAMALFQHGDLMSAKALIATSLAEFDNIRKLGFRQPIAVIPNGVDLDVLTSTDSVPAPHSAENRTVLFLSRVHPKKGLENLLRAWARLNPSGWRLRIAGPDEGGHLQKIMQLAVELGIRNAVEYVGSVDGEHKSAIYRGADLFVLPTFSENFGVVVAEALAHGLPVITTHGAPWADLEIHGCGWWIDIGVAPLERSLREAMSLSDDERRMMGARGREYVRRYDWDTIARQTAEVYRWVLDQGDKPECVITD
jgi:glycosyltransferase involved in cell wall biosynthesis